MREDRLRFLNLFRRNFTVEKKEVLIYNHLMNILVVGNVTKDVYLNLDSRYENFETDHRGIKWLDFGFDGSKHYFYNQNSSLGGCAVTLEVLQKMGLSATISDQPISFADDLDRSINTASVTCRYIFIADGQVSYLAPSQFKNTTFTPPAESFDYLYIDRSAQIDAKTMHRIIAYLDLSPKTKLVLYLQNTNNIHLNQLIPRASLIFLEKTSVNSELTYAPQLANFAPENIISISEDQLTYLNLRQNISVHRVDLLTHLSIYSVASATILSSFILGDSVEESLKLAKINLENSRIDTTLELNELRQIADQTDPKQNLTSLAANLLLPKKGILAADESGGSIQKKFEKLNIPDTYQNRRDYRNLFFTTPDLAQYVNGVILFDETAKQLADNGQNFVDFLISQGIIPGIKVDQGLEKFPNSTETYTKGLDGLNRRLKEYYDFGLRFAKWRAAFEITLSPSGEILTPTKQAIEENCRILTEYAKQCQAAGLVPIVEPEVVYAGDYPIEKNLEVTAHLLDALFQDLTAANVDLGACILKVNMILAGKQQEHQSTPEEVGQATAEVLKEHVPANLAGVVFLSGGQTVEQATANLAAIVKNGPFPWPVTFSFARALQDPALYAWSGNNANAEAAREAFLSRLIANVNALEKSK